MKGHETIRNNLLACLLAVKCAGEELKVVCFLFTIGKLTRVFFGGCFTIC